MRAQTLSDHQLGILERMHILKGVPKWELECISVEQLRVIFIQQGSRSGSANCTFCFPRWSDNEKSDALLLWTTQKAPPLLLGRNLVDVEPFDVVTLSWLRSNQEQ